MFWSLQALLVKKETTYGVDPVPTGAANGILAENVKISPMKGTKVQRKFDAPQFAPSPMLLVGLYSQISFEVEAKASGVAGTPPICAPLLQCCKMAQTIVASTSVTYNPHSGVQDSATIYFYWGDILCKMSGCRGTWKLKLAVLDVPRFEFTITGLFSVPAVGALPTLGGTMLTADFQKTAGAVSSANTPTFTVGGQALPLRNLNFDAGCAVTPRFLAGSESIIITDASESLDFQVEALGLATFNPFSLAQGMSNQALALVHGTVAGSKLGLNVPAMQFDLPDDPAAVDNVVEWKLSGVPQRNSLAGNDHYTIVFN